MLIRWAFVILCVAVPGIGSAAEWVPTKPLRLILPFPPGGSADLLGRAIATPLGVALGQQIVVDNRGGAGGIIAMEAIARAQPDGYTIGLASNSAHAANATLNPKLPYDSIKDFLPLTFTGQSPVTLVVNPADPAQTVAQMLARAKAASRPITFGSSGLGVSNHIAGELLKLHALQDKVTMTHVPYKGGGPAMIDLMGGQIDMMFNPLSSVLPFVQSKRLRALAIADRRRSALLPEVPTMVESGVPDFYLMESWGLVAPAATPPDIARRIRNEAVKVMKQPEFTERYAAQGLEIVPSTSEELRAFMIAEITKYRNVIQRAGIKGN
jgi:tripartite-type tricarboxylate transporter receptor subunit TctC